MGKLIHPQSELVREPNLLIPNKQPIGLVELIHNSLTKDMALCFVSGSPVNLVNGELGIYTGTPKPTMTVFKGRRCLETLNDPMSGLGSSSLHYPNIRLGINFTIMTLFRWGAGAASRRWNRLLSAKPKYNAASGFEISIDDNEVDRIYMRAANSAMHSFHMIDGEWKDGSIEHLTWTLEGVNSTGFYNGKYKSGPITIDALQDTNLGIALGSDGDQSDYSWYGHTFYTYIWNRVLTSEEIKQVYDDPYQFLIPNS